MQITVLIIKIMETRLKKSHKDKGITSKSSVWSKNYENGLKCYNLD